MESSRVIELMAKKLGKSASVEELKELERLLAEYPDYAWLEAIVGSLKGGPEHFERNIPAGELADSGWKHLADRLQSEDEGGVERSGTVVRVWKWMAAAVILGIIGSAIWYFREDRTIYADRVLNVKYGERSKVLLSDGTTVWLNAGSRLHYPDVFTGHKREVSLEGEAFFDVAKHPDAPFFVHAGELTIKVLGTRFDVKAYQGDAGVTTTLISGKVQVMMDGEPDKNIVLSPSEKLTVMNRVRVDQGVGVHYVVRGVPKAGNDSLPETAWIENRLVISNEAFGEVVKELERRYDVQIELTDARLRRQHLSGVFERENIQQVLDILKMTTKFKYSIEGKKVRLMPDL